MNRLGNGALTVCRSIPPLPLLQTYYKLTTNCLGRDKETYIVLISLHTDVKVGFRVISEGYQEAKRKNQVHFKTEFWINGEIHILGEEE